MYRNTILLAAVACLMFFTSGCATSTTGKADKSFDGLVPVTIEGLDDVWARGDGSLAAYDKIMLEDADIQFRPVEPAALQYNKPLSQIEYPVSEEAQEGLKQLLNDAFASEMSKSEVFTLAREAGPDVLRVKISLLDVVSNVPPGAAGKSAIFLDSVGEATLMLELFDSQSHAILARAMDRGAADYPAWNMSSGPVETRAEVEKLMASWATILRSELENVKQLLGN